MNLKRPPNCSTMLENKIHPCINIINNIINVASYIATYFIIY